MSPPHHRIHRLAVAGGAILALVAALPAGATARPPRPAIVPVRQTPTVDASISAPVAPNPDNRAYGSGRVLPHTNWVTPTGSRGPLPADVYTPQAPAAKTSGGVALLVSAGFAGFVVLAGLTGAGVRRRRRVKVAA